MRRALNFIFSQLSIRPWDFLQYTYCLIVCSFLFSFEFVINACQWLIQIGLLILLKSSSCRGKIYLMRKFIVLYFIHIILSLFTYKKFIPNKDCKLFLYFFSVKKYFLAFQEFSPYVACPIFFSTLCKKSIVLSAFLLLLLTLFLRMLPEILHWLFQHLASTP